MFQRHLVHLLGAGARTELAEPRALFGIATLVFPHDCVASAAEALVEQLVARFVVCGVSEFSGSYLLFRVIDHLIEDYTYTIAPVLTLINKSYRGEKFRILLNRYRLDIVARFPARTVRVRLTR